MNRRHFWRTLTTAGGATLLIQACGNRTVVSPSSPAVTPAPAPTTTPAAIPAPTATPAPPAPAAITPAPAPRVTPATLPVPVATTSIVPAGTARVALVKTDNRAEGVRRAIELLGVSPARGSRVFLKPNFNSADPAPGSTHPDVLRTLVTTLADMGSRGVTVADRSGMGNTRRVMEQLGVFAMSRELGFDVLVFDELEKAQWALRESRDFHWSRGFMVPKALLDAECVVQACALKTHRFGGHFTLSLKNSVGLAAKTVETGGYDYMGELHSTPYQRHMIAEINTAYAPGLIVMDGVEAFVSGGPDRGKKVSANVVLAATDRVAIDAVGVAILRMFGTTPEVSAGRVFEQAQIARAVELRLGVNAPEQIALVTGDPASAAYAEQVRTVLLA